MKKLALFGLLIAASFAHAGDQRPDRQWVRYQSWTVNFDGSTSIVEPKFFAQNDFRSIYVSPTNTTPVPALVCAHLGFSKTNGYTFAPAGNESIIVLNDDGSFSSVKDATGIDWVFKIAAIACTN